MTLVPGEDQITIMKILSQKFLQAGIQTYMLEAFLYDAEGKIEVRFSDPASLLVKFPKDNLTEKGMKIISGAFHKDPTRSTGRTSHLD